MSSAAAASQQPVTWHYQDGNWSGIRQDNDPAEHELCLVQTNDALLNQAEHRAFSSQRLISSLRSATPEMVRRCDEAIQTVQQQRRNYLDGEFQRLFAARNIPACLWLIRGRVSVESIPNLGHADRQFLSLLSDSEFARRVHKIQSATSLPLDLARMMAECERDA